ncbi:MAG: uncharacterized protein A8A55_3470, partial [Amphiamblys sp. WSBS2006]
RTGRDTTWELLESKDTTESWARYQKLGLKRSSEAFRRLASTTPDLQRGWKKTLQLRTGNLWTGHTAAKRGVVSEDLLSSCPACGEETPETPRHMICECKKWDRDREGADAYAGMDQDRRKEWLQAAIEPADLLHADADDDAERKLIWVTKLLAAIEGRHQGAIRKFVTEEKVKKGRPCFFAGLNLK